MSLAVSIKETLCSLALTALSFFEDFSTSYSYTRIGHIEDAGNFADTLASGTVEVMFETGEQEEKK